MRAFLSKILPHSIIEIYRNYKRRSRESERADLERKSDVVTAQMIEKALRGFGIGHGDVVMLHSSLSKIGLVKDGAQAVIDAFLNVIGDSGTLVMPAFPAIGFNYDYLKSDPVFDIRNTPSKMGIITETFRKMSGVKRSFHPTDSVCALGKEAGFITNSHFGQITPYNSESPFFKLSELRAKIVMLGVDLTTLTNFHTLEDAAENFRFPVYHERIFDCKMADEDGEMKTMRTKVHDPKMSKKRRCNDFGPMFEKAGFLKRGAIGHAPVMVIEAKAMHEWMLKNYREKGITMYTPQGNI